MEIKTGYSATGNEIKYIKLSWNKGIKHFSSIGYKPCINKRYMQKDNKYVHWNDKDKHWIIEENTKTGKVRK